MNPLMRLRRAYLGQRIGFTSHTKGVGVIRISKKRRHPHLIPSHLLDVYPLPSSSSGIHHITSCRMCVWRVRTSPFQESPSWQTPYHPTPYVLCCQYFIQVSSRSTRVDMQEDVFWELFPLLHNVLFGDNVCVLAYGQSRSDNHQTMVPPPPSSHTHSSSIVGLLAE